MVTINTPDFPSAEQPPLLVRFRHSDRRLALTFGLRALALASPLLTAFCLVTAGLWRTGETWPINKVINFQRKHPSALFLRGQSDQLIPEYKLEVLNQDAPQIEVLVVGSSRSMKLRYEMFGIAASRFRNAGGLVGSVSDLRKVLETPGLKPRVIIAGIDIWWFNRNYEDRRFPVDTSLPPDNWQVWLTASRSLLYRSLRDPRLLFSLWNSPTDRIGLGAISQMRGFRADGSMSAPEIEPDPTQPFSDRGSPPIASRIRKRQFHFVASPGLDTSKLDEFTSLLSELKAKNIFFAGFLPPFSKECVSLLSTMPEHAELFRQIRQSLPSAIQQTGHAFFDASTTETVGLDDTYMSDGYHAEETFHLYLLRRLLQDKQFSRHFPNSASAISRALTDPKTGIWRSHFESN